VAKAMLTIEECDGEIIDVTSWLSERQRANSVETRVKDIKRLQIILDIWKGWKEIIELGGFVVVDDVTLEHEILKRGHPLTRA